MIMTYDCLIYAAHHEEFRRQIKDIIARGLSTELCYNNTHRMYFNSEKKTVQIEPYSVSSDFCMKIVPKVLTYEAVLKIISGEWNNVLSEDIQDCKMRDNLGTDF